MNHPFAVCSLHMTLSDFRHKNSWAIFLLRMLDPQALLVGNLLVDLMAECRYGVAV
jgi:hypothetical protein